jgi:opacity protein-like surface antigen
VYENGQISGVENVNENNKKSSILIGVGAGTYYKLSSSFLLSVCIKYSQYTIQGDTKIRTEVIRDGNGMVTSTKTTSVSFNTVSFKQFSPNIGITYLFGKR